MTTLAIDSLVYDVYATVAEADGYLMATLGNETWLATSELIKSQALVSATRLLDRQCWQGTANPASGSTLVWPRTDTGIEGVEDDVVPNDIVTASIELANLLVTGSDVVSNPLPGAQRLNLIKAGSVMLQYFRGAEGAFAAGSRFPTVVQELVKRYMCGASFVAGAVASGTDGESVTGGDFGFSEGV